MADSRANAEASSNAPHASPKRPFPEVDQSRAGLDEEDEEFRGGEIEDPDDAASIVGISIGPQQSRLASSKTPTIEKTNALALGLESANEQELHDDYSPTGSRSAQNGSIRTGARQRYPSSSDHRLPSPWRAKARLFENSSRSSTVFKNAIFRRPSKSVDAKSDPSNSSWSAHLLSALGSLPKSLHVPHLHPPLRSAEQRPFEPTAASQNNRSDAIPSTTSDRLAQHGPRRDYAAAGPINTRPKFANPSLYPVSQATESQTSAHLVAGSSPTGLRRSASAHSFLVMSALSPVSSLGDDSRFEQVHDQVNSRLKAIRDGWQDANFKLPAFRGMPSIAALSLESLKPDLAFARNLGSRLGSPARSTDTLSSARGGGDRKMSIKSAEAQPEPPQDPFEKACADLTGDLVVLGGYRGSILRSAEPPHRQVWVPIKVGLNVRKVDLEVGLEPEDDENMPSKIIPSGMLTHIGPVSISKRLFTQLYACDNAQKGKLRIHNYGYDWRLDPHLLSRQLIAYLETLPCNQPGVTKNERGATLIAHSLGGLITRHVINQRPDLVAGVVYAGTPMAAVSILGPLRNGDDVLLSSRVLTAQVNFTIRTSFALLPLDGKGFLNPDTHEEFPVDFFDPATWKEYRLSPCIARPLPPLNATSSNGLPNVVSLLAAKLPRRRNSLPNAGAPSLSANRKRSSTFATSLTTDAKQKESILKGNVAAVPSQDGMQPPASAESVATAVTIPHDRAMAYLKRILASVKRFKQELAYRPELGDQNVYPPAAVMYGKSTPTIFAAKVADREAIKRRDAYDNIIFHSGDGVVLARAAMLPEGYKNVPGGRVSSNRGHVALLGDLEGVGKALNAIIAARKAGFGLGPDRAAGVKTVA